MTTINGLSGVNVNNPGGSDKKATLDNCKARYAEVKKNWKKILMIWICEKNNTSWNNKYTN